MKILGEEYERQVPLDIKPALRTVLDSCHNGYALPSDLAEVIERTLNYIAILEGNNEVLRIQNAKNLRSLSVHDRAHLEAYYQLLGRNADWFND